MCTNINITLNLTVNSNNALDFTAETVLDVPFGYTSFEAYYTINGGSQYALLDNTNNVYNHLNEGLLFYFYVKIDDCVYTASTLVPSSPDCDNGFDVCYNEVILDVEGEVVIEGCTNPLSPNYNPSATVDDGSCLDPIEGCMNPLALNYNPSATVDDGSCILPISGCTNPLSPNYNPLANVDDGSCIPYTYIAGCTNPLASNYNPSATVNDGSCIFVTGCTDPFADNYNPLAAIDDGSCKCTDLNLFLSFGQASGITLSVLEDEGDCDFYLKFNSLLKINCQDVLNFYSRTEDATLLGILNDLSLNVSIYTGNPTTITGNTITTSGDTFNYTGNTIQTLSGNTNYELAETINVWNFNYEDDITGVALEGTEDKCNLLLEGLALEQGIICYEDLSPKFQEVWNNYQIKIDKKYANKSIQIAINYENFSFSYCSLLDELEFYKICQKQKQECVLIPSTFGFLLEKETDNKKSWVKQDTQVIRSGDTYSYIENNNKLVLNTKEALIRINVPNYIEKDVVKYFNTSEQYLTDYSALINLSQERLNKTLIDVRNRLTTNRYEILHQTYDLYLNNLNSCAIKSKELSYEYIFNVYDRVKPIWYNFVKQSIPSTTIWNDSTHYYANSVLHNQKHKYKTYSLQKGDLTDAIIECSLVTDNACDKYLSSIDKVYEENFICISGETLGVGYINEGSYFTGRFVQYLSTGETATIIDQLDFPSVTTYDCTPIPCITNVNIDSVTTTPTGSTQIGQTTELVFSTTGVTDASELYFTVNGTSYPITAFDVEASTGATSYTTLLDENIIRLETIGENCDNDFDTTSFFHCEIGYENTIPIVDPLNPPFGRQITITVFANDIDSIIVYVNGATATPILIAPNTYEFVISYLDSGRPPSIVISINRINCENEIISYSP